MRTYLLKSGSRQGGHGSQRGRGLGQPQGDGLPQPPHDGGPGGLGGGHASNPSVPTRVNILEKAMPISTPRIKAIPK